LKKIWIPWSSQGMTYLLCVFHEQATHTHNCDTASKPGNDINVALLMTVLVSHAYLGYTLVMKEMVGKYMLK